MSNDMKLAIDGLDTLVAAFHKDAATAPNAATKRDLTKIGEFAGNVATIIKREHAALEAANAALVAECERLREALKWMVVTFEDDRHARLYPAVFASANRAITLTQPKEPKDV